MGHLKPLVIGAGFMGRAYIKHLYALGDRYGFSSADIGVVDIDPMQREEVRAQFPDVRISESIASASHGEPNAAIITTPSHAHASDIRACDALGIRHVLVEKPLVESSRELEGLPVHVYTAHLINFSGAVARLREWMSSVQVFPAEIVSTWYQDWYRYCDRWIEAASDGKIVHPLALAFTIIEHASPISGFSDVQTTASYTPHIRPEIRTETLAKGHVSLDAHSNSTAQLMVRAHTKSCLVSNVHILGSFGIADDRRFVSIVFVAKNQEPKYKAVLEFDRPEGDRIMVREAAPPGRIIFDEVWKGDKILHTLEAALDAFSGREPDGRLTTFSQASEIVGILDAMPKYPVFTN